MSERVFIGVVQLALTVPGARSLKELRAPLRSLRDRLLNRFDVTCHTVASAQSASGRQVVVITTAGNEPRTVRSLLDRVVHFVHTHPVVVAVDVAVDVFRWAPRQPVGPSLGLSSAPWLDPEDGDDE